MWRIGVTSCVVELVATSIEKEDLLINKGSEAVYSMAARIHYPFVCANVPVSLLSRPVHM